MGVEGAPAAVSADGLAYKINHTGLTGSQTGAGIPQSVLFCTAINPDTMLSALLLISSPSINRWFIYIFMYRERERNEKRDCERKQKKKAAVSVIIQYSLYAFK